MSVRATRGLALGLAFACASVDAEVRLTGVSTRQVANIEAHLGLSELSCDAPAWLVRWEYREVDAEVAAALEALGYYSAHIEKTLNFPADGCWVAELTIDRGEPVLVEKLLITIDQPLGSEASIASRVTGAQALLGKRLDHGRYEAIKRGLLEDASVLGYFDAKFVRSEVRVEVARHSAVVDLELAGGPRFVFGDIEVVGDALDRRLLDQLIPIRSGDPYDGALLAKLRRNLAESGYFRRTTVIADSEAAVDHRIAVRIELTPRAPPWTYSVGPGYATDTGARLRAVANNALFNSAGHRVSVNTVLSRGNSSLDAEYRIPHKNPLNDWFAFDAGIAHLDTDTSSSDISRLGVRHTYPRGGWTETDFADLTREDFTIAHESGVSNLLLFGSTLGRVSRDRPIRPTAGHRVEVTMRGATQALGSDTDFAQVLVAGKLVHGLSERVRAIVRADLGATWKDDFDALPPTVRFFAGGDTSIRGYAYQSVGPEVNGNVVGGSYLLTGSLELDYEFRPKWSIAAFVDSGSAYDDRPQFFTGVGAGIGYQSPVGPIRVYVGHPLEDENVEWRLAIVIGPDL